MNTVIERIKKLLRLARSSNPHEAALAMQRALALAEEHRIAVETLDPDRAAPSFTHQSGRTFVRVSHDQRFAALIVHRFFRVHTLIENCVRVDRHGWPSNGQKMTFIGTESDVEIAIYVFNFLTHHFAWCWRKHRGRCRHRYSYVHGMFIGLWSKLSDAEPSMPERQTKGNELELSMRSYIAEHFGELERTGKLPKAKARAAAWAGYVQGRKTEIRPGIKQTESSPLALT